MSPPTSTATASPLQALLAAATGSLASDPHLRVLHPLRVLHHLPPEAKPGPAPALWYRQVPVRTFGCGVIFTRTGRAAGHWSPGAAAPGDTAAWVPREEGALH